MLGPRNETVVCVSALLASLLLAVPVSVADPITTTGSEEMPELSDASGDVDYEDHYTGPQDHDYLDILASWIEYDNRTDQVAFHLKVADASLLQDPPDGWYISCSVEGTMTTSEGPTGSLSYGWYRDANGTSNTYVHFRPPDSSPATNFGGQELAHAYNETLSEPGYFGFQVDRNDVLQFGNALNNPHATCQEIYAPWQMSPGLTKLYWNRDDGESTASYSFAALQPASVEDDEDPFAGTSPRAPTTTPGDASPGLSILALLVVGMVLAWRASKRP